MDFEKTLNHRDENLSNIFGVGLFIVFITLLYINRDIMSGYQIIMSVVSFIVVTNGVRLFQSYEKQRAYDKDSKSMKLTYNDFLKKWAVIQTFPETYTELKSYFRNKVNETDIDTVTTIGFYNIVQPIHLLKEFYRYKNISIDLTKFGTLGDAFSELEDYVYYLKFKLGVNFKECFVEGDSLILKA